LALRTQQVIAHESGAARVVDPLGGSYYVEELTDMLEAAILEQVEMITTWGGPAAAIASGQLHRLLADSAYALQTAIEDGRQGLVGVNIHRAEGRAEVRSPFKIDAGLEQTQRDALTAVRHARDESSVALALDGLLDAARNGVNTVAPLRAAARARATLGEMTATLESVHGRFKPLHTY